MLGMSRKSTAREERNRNVYIIFIYFYIKCISRCKYRCFSPLSTIFLRNLYRCAQKSQQSQFNRFCFNKKRRKNGNIFFLSNKTDCRFWFIEVIFRFLHTKLYVRCSTCSVHSAYAPIEYCPHSNNGVYFLLHTQAKKKKVEKTPFIMPYKESIV